MTSPFSELARRVDDVERRQRIPVSTLPDPYSTNQLDVVKRRLERIEVALPPVVRLGTICAGEPVWASASFVMTASYSTGGDPIVLPDVPGTAVPFFPPRNGYIFVFASPDKVQAWIAGAEAASTTDLTSLGTMAYAVMGDTPSERAFTLVNEAVLLESVKIEVSADVGEDSTNYWSFQLVQHESTDTQRLELGSPLTLAVRKLSANVAVTLYEPDEARQLAQGDTLSLEITQTGTPTHLADLAVWMNVRRRTA